MNSNSGPKNDPKASSSAETHDQHLLDEAIEDTFPASDAPSETHAPKDKRYSNEPPRNDPNRRAPIPGKD